MNVTSATLCGRLASDRDRAFPDLVRSMEDGVYSGALQFTRNPHDAQDVTQETFVRVYRALGTYEPDRIRALDLRPWVWTIALNLCRNRARSRSRRPESPPVTDLRDDGPGPEDEVTSNAALGVWRRRLATITGPQRTAVVLRHVVGLSYEEIAASTGRAESTCRSDVRRGLARLRTLIAEEER